MSVKFLLAAINSKYIHMNPAVYSLRTYALGSGALNTENAEIAIAEYTINQSMDEILGDLYERKPDVIGFSCYIWNWQMTKELMVEVKKLLPQTDIFLGGPEVSYEAEKIMEQYGRANEETGNGPVIRGIILGEGEKTFCELAEYYADESCLPRKRCPQQDDGCYPDIQESDRKSSDSAGAADRERMLKDIPGLLLDTGYTGVREPLSFSEIPFLYEEQRLSGKGLQDFRNKIIYYESSRGCPFRCSYCLSSIDKTLRLRDVNRVLPELQFFLDCKVPQVKFIDRTFNCYRAHAMAIWQYLTEHDNGVTNFHFEIAAELITEEELEYMTRNCRFLPRVYWEWLSSFRFDPDKIDIHLDTTGRLHIEVSDFLYKVTLYEVPLLAIVSEIKNKFFGNVPDMSEILCKLSEKVESAPLLGVRHAEKILNRRAGDGDQTAE